MDRRGDVLVEFALTATVFFMTILGIMEFGVGIWRFNVVANLAKEGARRAAVCGAGTSLTSTDCDIQTYLSGRAYGIGITATTTPSNLSTVNPGDVVTVQVQTTLPLMSRLLPQRTLTLKSAANMIAAR